MELIRMKNIKWLSREQLAFKPSNFNRFDNVVWISLPFCFTLTSSKCSSLKMMYNFLFVRLAQNWRSSSVFSRFDNHFPQLDVLCFSFTLEKHFCLDCQTCADICFPFVGRSSFQQYCQRRVCPFVYTYKYNSYTCRVNRYRVGVVDGNISYRRLTFSSILRSLDTRSPRRRWRGPPHGPVAIYIYTNRVPPTCVTAVITPCTRVSVG